MAAIRGVDWKCVDALAAHYGFHKERDSDCAPTSSCPGAAPQVPPAKRRPPVKGEAILSDNVIFLPEKVVTGLLGRDLPASIGQEFNYDGKRYRVRQRDPSRSEGGVPCELVEPPVQEHKRRRTKGRGR